jgi:NADH dehydrogenase
MRIVVLGGGYAGLVAARSLERELPDSAELTVIDDTGTHLIQHELHRVIRRPDLAAHLEIPLDDILDRAEIIADRVTELRPDDARVDLASGSTIDYDAAAVCLGAETDPGDRPGVQTYGQPLKRLSHAQAIRDRFMDVRSAGEAQIVIGGAGLSGIQVAGELAAMRDAGEGDSVNLTLVEMQETVAPGFPTSLQRALRRHLREAGITLELGTTITEADDTTVETAEGRTMEADQFIWTGGIRGSGALGTARPRVRADLKLNERTFIAGDAARIVDSEGQSVPATAQAAVRAGEVCARNVLRSVGLGPDRPARFAFDSRGWLVSVGDEAIAQVGPAVFSGPSARTLKASAGLRYLAKAGAVSEALEVVSAELYG